ncbi:MAG: hypothetical protein HOY75_13370 [Streptomyces sp.]|nr:hypothetical protein [Streptomyces sp.]
MAEHVANDDNWMTAPEETCPGCGSERNRRVRIDLDCPRFMQGGRLMACQGCGNAVRFECQAPDEDGDLLEDGCGWWFQYPLHEQAANWPSMGQAPSWDYARYRL